MHKFGLAALKNLGAGTVVGLASVGLVAAFVACTTTTVDVNGNPDGGGSNTDGGTNGDGSTTPPPGSTPAKSGQIDVRQNSAGVDPDVVFTVLGSAFFVDATGKTATGSGATNCTTSTEGACSVIECDLTQDAGSSVPDTDAGAPAASPNAGTITVESPTAEFDIELKDDSSGDYAPYSSNTQTWTADDELTFSAPGATVPKFNEKVAAGSVIKVTAPAAPAGVDPLVVKRTAAIPLTWTDGKAGDVTVMVNSTTASKNVILTCKYKADANTGEIPAAAAAKLQAGAATSFSITTTSSKTFENDGWSITLNAHGEAKAGDSNSPWVAAAVTVED